MYSNIIKFIVIFFIIFYSINADNKENEYCYLKITCKLIPKASKQEVAIKVSKKNRCSKNIYFLIDTPNIGGILINLKTDTTYILAIAKKMPEDNLEDSLRKSYCPDTIELHYMPYFRKTIDDYFIFKANDTIIKVVEKYEFLPKEIFDFFEKNE